MYKHVCVLCIYLTLSLEVVDGYKKQDLKDLKRKLFDDGEYDKSVRPIDNQSLPIKLEVSFDIVAINNFDMENGRFEATGYYLARWFDDGLTWNESEHGDITRLRLNTDDIWSPELIQIQTVGERFLVSNVFVESSGRVTWITSGEFITFCELHIRYYPQDKHRCDILLMSSSYIAPEVVLEPLVDHVELSNFQKHGKWEITDTQTTAILFEDKNTKLVSSALNHSIKLLRIPWFDILHKVLPLYFILLANIFVHVQPLLSGERISFAITVLLAIVFWEAIIVEDLPKTSSEISLLSMILTVSIVNCTFTVILSVLLCRMAIEQDRPIPKFLKKTALRRKDAKSRRQIISVKQKQLSAIHTLETRIENNENNENNGSKTNGQIQSQVPMEDIDVSWLDVAETIDILLGFINFVVLVIIFIGFTIAFNK